MFKQLVTILILVNIFVGYYAEAFQGESLDCRSSISQESAHVAQNIPDESNSKSPEHSDKNCITSHCHFGHCATVKQIADIKLSSTKMNVLAFSKNLSPIDFIFDLLRPPISA